MVGAKSKAVLEMVKHGSTVKEAVTTVFKLSTPAQTPARAPTPAPSPTPAQIYTASPLSKITTTPPTPAQTPARAPTSTSAPSPTPAQIYSASPLPKITTTLPSPAPPPPSEPTSKDVMATLSESNINKPVNLRPGQSINVTYEKNGKIETIGSHVGKQIERQGWSIVKIESLGSEGVFFRQPTTEEWSEASGKALGKYYTGLIEYHKEEPSYIPGWVKAQVEPEDQQKAYESFLGNVTIPGQVYNLPRYGPNKSTGIKPIPEVKKSSLFDIYYGMSSFATAQIFNPDSLTIIQHQLTGATPQGKDIKESLNMYVKQEREFLNQVKAQNYETYKNLWESGDILGIGGRVISSPIGAGFSAYGIGAGLGGLAMSKVGQYSLIKVGSRVVTPSVVANVGVGAGFSTQTILSGKESYEKGRFKEWMMGAGMMMPLVYYPFKWGYNVGMGAIQRRGAMSTVTNPFERTQQQALYDLMRTTEKLHEPYTRPRSVYDIMRVQTLKFSQANKMSTFFDSSFNQVFRKPAIGGSTAMDIQMGEYFRGGNYPSRLIDIATTRQLRSGEFKPLRLTEAPVDIDILLGSRFAFEKTANLLGKQLDTHVHISRPNTYLWGGYSSKPFTRSIVQFPNKILELKTLGIREQLLRYAVSVLPSETKQTGYRSFKDIPGLFDVVKVLQFQKGGLELSNAMDRYLNYERYQPPKITFGERILGKMGGVVQPEYIETYGGKYIEPFYPREVYMKLYTPFSMVGGYVSPGYRQKISNYNLKQLYKPVQYLPSIVSPGYKPSYKPVKPSMMIPSVYPQYRTPKYESPSYKPSIITPRYTPPYEPRYVPEVNITPPRSPITPRYTPPYEPRYVPEVNITPPRSPLDFKNLENYKDEFFKALFGARFKKRVFHVPNLWDLKPVENKKLRKLLWT